MYVVFEICCVFQDSRILCPLRVIPKDTENELSYELDLENIDFEGKTEFLIFPLLYQTCNGETNKPTNLDKIEISLKYESKLSTIGATKTDQIE